MPVIVARQVAKEVEFLAEDGTFTPKREQAEKLDVDDIVEIDRALRKLNTQGEARHYPIVVPREMAPA